MANKGIGEARAAEGDFRGSMAVERGKRAKRGIGRQGDRGKWLEGLNKQGAAGDKLVGR